ncbi:hypothetical protein [Tengunoibacter tsumagoiensis]|uniref:Uncharacterized protein n=1 Tax=Tengunoibacter tsumagoiensis TaxID=2014871 RepID=A0A402A2S9_9CHLR|nr:hypothetical protein [Tengunoibacter tsumagoiensis]GCE13440.1 hypothetical protein KTT_32990 [Tengunoibacter tsumagoiensis]
MSQSYESSKERIGFAEVARLFAELPGTDLQQFVSAYHVWMAQQRLEDIAREIAVFQNRIAENEKYLQPLQPSPVALAALAQFQAYGVSDSDLLDRMLERGDEWLDHTLALLERCDQLDMIGSDYTSWCHHALEGAYDWMTSIEDEATPRQPVDPVDEQQVQLEHLFADVTEDLLLQKLMSEPDSLREEPPAAPDIQDEGEGPEDLYLLNDVTEEILFQKLMSDSGSLPVVRPDTGSSRVVDVEEEMLQPDTEEERAPQILEGADIEGLLSALEQVFAGDPLLSGDDYLPQPVEELDEPSGQTAENEEEALVVRADEERDDLPVRINEMDDLPVRINEMDDFSETPLVEERPEKRRKYVKKKKEQKLRRSHFIHKSSGGFRRSIRKVRHR